MERFKIAEIEQGIYWVGGSGQEGGLHCNPYLIVEEDEAVLIDPGSVLDFEYVFENVCSIIPLEKVKYVILHHQDPDFCSSVPLFEQKGGSFQIVTHWRTQALVKYYGIKSDYYIVNENDFKLELKSGRTLGFVQTPYLHFPGAIATYDYQSKVLFSSDLFGAFSYEWSLYAQDDYMEKMKTFHEHYMPSNDILRPVMEMLLDMDISMIAPQHGSIIKDKVIQHIKALRDLECGSFISTLKKDLAKNGGYKTICSEVLKRYAAVFSKSEILEAVSGLDIAINEQTMDITDYNYTGSKLWELLFEKISAKKGVHWLTVIEPMVRKLSKEYDVSVPQVFEATLKKAEEIAVTISNENALLKEINSRLSRSIKEVEERLIKCPVTGLYNYVFFKSYLSTELENIYREDSAQNPGLVAISIDNMAKIRFSYGDNEVDDIMRNIVYTINEIKDDNSILFRLQGALLACYFPHSTKEDLVCFAEKIRNTIGSSGKFIEKVTVSIGVFCLDEIRTTHAYSLSSAELVYNIAMMRVKLAKSMGMNIVCSSSSVENYQEEIGKILIIDTDAVNVDVLKTFLENLSYKVITAKDGEEGLQVLEKEEVSLIISEIMIPKIDGFLVRERLLAQSNTKNIPFIFVSHLKNDDSVKRAADLDIEHYFKKPFMLSEMLGVIKNKIKGETDQ